MAEVKLVNVNKIYPNGYHAVIDSSLDIGDKEFMVLVGPSGCGKTTTLRMIAGLEDITTGDLFIGDRKVNDVDPKDRDIAMVFQNYALYPHMSIRENMSFGLKLRKTPKAEIESRVANAAKILNLEALLDRKPKQLSGGQRQRVALGRAIVRNPQVFLMDEPLSNLDAKLRVQMRAELIKLHRELEATFIYVTHDQTEAMTMGTRLCVMKDCLIQQVADPTTIYNRPANTFVAGFIGSPQMNMVTVPVKATAAGMALVLEGTELVPTDAALQSALKGYDGKTVIMGIRPEDVTVGADENAPHAPLNAKVVVKELLGSETMVYISVLGVEMVSKVRADLPIQIGDQLKVAFDPRKVHLFDVDTTKSLLYI